MKVFAALLSILLIAATLYSPASSSPSGSQVHNLRAAIYLKYQNKEIVPTQYASDTTPCCFSFTSLPPPLTHVKEYFYTSSRCGNQGVVFITRKNRQLCANPEKKWVRSYINSLEMS